MAIPHESHALDKPTAPDVAEQSKPFTGSHFQAALKDIYGCICNATANLDQAYETAGPEVRQ